MTDIRVFSFKQYNLEDESLHEHLFSVQGLKMTERTSKPQAQDDIAHGRPEPKYTPRSNADQERAIAALAALSYRTGELDDYLKQICQAVLDVLGDGAAAVTLYRNGKKNVIARVPHSPKVGVPLDIHGHLSTFVVESGEPLRVADAKQHPEYGKPPEGFCAYLGIPLKLPDGKIVGTLCYFNQAVREFSLQDEHVAHLFAERIAIALDNYELYLQLKAHSENLEQLVEERTEALLQTQKALMQKEKLAAIGEFASHLTHEIRNPLATIKLALEYFERQEDQRSAKRAQLAGSEITRLEHMLNEVLCYARPADIHCDEISLSAFIKDFVSTHDAMLKQKQQHFTIKEKARPHARADRDKLTQVFLNLARNACEAAEPNQAITLTLDETEQDALISFHNYGEAIPKDKLDQITDAFVSTKTKGTGLGLAIVKNLVAAHHGKLEIQSTPEAGTHITVRFPKPAINTQEGLI